MTQDGAIGGGYTDSQQNQPNSIFSGVEMDDYVFTWTWIERLVGMKNVNSWVA